MIEIEDIKDEDSLIRWLEKWPRANGNTEDEARAIAVTIAHRAAMRVLPVWWDWTMTPLERKSDVTALSALRCNLVLAIACNFPGREIDNDVADNLSDSIAKAYDDVKPEADAAASAAVSAYSAATYDAVYDAAKVASFAAKAIDADIAWVSVRADCNGIVAGENILLDPIWRETDNPLGWRDDDIRLGYDWEVVKSRISAPEWSFWIKWYDDALAGTPQNWKMLEQIALIESEVWDAGAVAVAEEIERIEAEFDGQAEPMEPMATPEQAITANAKMILLQIDTLKLFVEEEIQRLRGSNVISDVAMKRITLLEALLVSIGKMQSALSDDATNALVVFEENLPQVFEKADELAEDGGTTEVSETIATMGTSIEYLTKRGTPGTLATGIAALDIIKTTIKNWFNRPKLSKD